MKENIMNILIRAQDIIANAYHNIKQFFNSYEYNYPLIFAIAGGVIILIIIFKIVSKKKNKKFVVNESVESEETKSRTSREKELPPQLIAEEVPTVETTEPIAEIDKIVEETIPTMDENIAQPSDEEMLYADENEVEFKEYKASTDIPIEFIDSLKKDFEAEFINIIKRNLPFSIEYNKIVSLPESIIDRCRYIIDRLNTIKDKYEFLEEYYISEAMFYFYTDNENEAFNILSAGIENYSNSNKLLIEKAKILISRNNIETAKELLIKAQELNSADFDSYLLLGEIYFKENKFVDALNIYKKVILLDPQNSTGFAYKGYLLAKKGFISDGEKDLKRSIALDYKNSRAYYMLADIYLETGNYSKAILMFNKAKKFNCIMKDLERKLAISYYKVEKYPAVVALLKNLKIEDMYLKNILGDSFYKLNLLDDAINIYDKLFNAEVDENKKMNYLDRLIEIYKKKNDIMNVVKYLKMKLEKNKDDLTLHREIGDIYYFNLKDNNEARKYYELIIEKDKNFDVIYHLINIYFKERNYKKCIELYKKIEKREAIIPEIFYKVGLSFFKEHDHDNTIQLLSKSEITGWVDEELYNALGYSYLKTKHFNKAEESFQKALTINPYNSQIHNNLGTIYAHREQFKDAVKEFKEALNLDPNNKDILYNLYRVYKILSESEAEKYLAKLEEVI